MGVRPASIDMVHPADDGGLVFLEEFLESVPVVVSYCAKLIEVQFVPDRLIVETG